MYEKMINLSEEAEKNYDEFLDLEDEYIQVHDNFYSSIDEKDRIKGMQLTERATMIQQQIDENNEKIDILSKELNLK